jgi:predicted nuclease of predicted toxin-antitoxin system
MKLLFDQNLSPRLPRLLADIYPESVHVREVGLRDAHDIEIWEYAKAHGYAIVSKDSDFQQRSLLQGAPPKFIWLRVGNCTVKRTEELLRS